MVARCAPPPPPTRALRARTSQFPFAHGVCQRVLGKAGKASVEREAMLIEHMVTPKPFTDAALACLPEPGWQISEAEIARRLDLRKLTVCSVDPPGAMDIDDAPLCP